MKDQELFRIFDACQPTVAQAKKYYELISGSARSEFDLVFSKDGNKNITRKLRKDLGKLEGIIVDGVMFYTRSITIDDFDPEKSITHDKVFRIAKALYPEAALMERGASFFILEKNLEAIKKLIDKLTYLGYEAPLKTKFMLADDSSLSDDFAFQTDLDSEKITRVNIAIALKHGSSFILTRFKK